MKARPPHAPLTIPFKVSPLRHQIWRRNYLMARIMGFDEALATEQADLITPLSNEAITTAVVRQAGIPGTVLARAGILAESSAYTTALSQLELPLNQLEPLRLVS